MKTLSLQTAMNSSKILKLAAVLTLTFTSAFFTSGFASADALMSHPATPKVVYRAALAPTSRFNNIPKSIVLTETLNAEAADATEFVLKVNSTSYPFKVLQATQDACHSIRYLAHNQDEHGNVMDLELIDNQGRTCTDFAGNQAAWVAHLQVPTPDRPTTIDFVGAPVPVDEMSTVVPSLDVRTDLNSL